MTDFFRTLEDLPAAHGLTARRRDEHVRRLERLRADLRELEPARSCVEELCGVAAVHPDPWVRRLAVDALPGLAAAAPESTATAIVWASHDPEDFVAFAAIRAAGRLRLQEALRDFLLIVGNASRRLNGEAGKPVGIGHAVVLDAIAQVVGSRDERVLSDLEERLFEGTLDFPQTFPPAEGAPARGGHTHEGMVYVPPGEVRFGVPEGLAGDLTFDWDDVAEPWSARVDGFWIDVHPVTAEQYDAFAAGPDALEHRHCHPGEPPGKLHARNTVLDPRFDGRRPATGVCWFDASAYAASHGKRLPREAEWQLAAQGDDDRAYPWGDAFRPDRAQWIGHVTGCAPTGLEDWRGQLLTLAAETPEAPVAPVGAFDDASPAGVRGLSGNTWEWTGTNFFSRGDASPAAADRDALEVLYDWASYPVIRGGTWTSPPELLSVKFRGRDLLTDRHFENGFRCVCDCPPPEGATA
ncbi:MAG TPA: SUMF1/EgtB/PvdO family nonheme iron enzyme [Solirubrobacteraceae bacterium]|jgi:formylglycine-generating enzyme required for sulfatase activity|nr:SUMF1/EgtB/PvdO family nonheme iron enzyme [Solirubrobacteraceae bacterium]